MPSFREKLIQVQQKNESLLCVGLDPDVSKFPEGFKQDASSIVAFHQTIIESTKDLVCAYKPNMAFYEAHGLVGLKALEETLALIPQDIPVILDAKRGDIGNTSKLYAQAAFDWLKVDAVTLHGYMGSDSITPFLKYKDKAIFILVKTSNPSAVELEDLPLSSGKSVYSAMADLVSRWNEQGSAEVGAVVGATYPKDMERVREILPHQLFLIPGVGSQGGDSQAVLQASLVDASHPFDGSTIINASRAVLYAGSGKDFSEKARVAAENLRAELRV